MMHMTHHGRPTRGMSRRRIYGVHAYAHDAPWSPDSRHVEKTRLWEITSPPPKPSLALIPARGPLKKTLPAYAYGHMLMRAVEEDITYVASACAHMHMQVVLSHMHMHMHAPAARSAWHAHAPGSACTLHPCTMHAYHAGACGPRGPRGPCIPCIPRIPCIPCRCMRATWAMRPTCDVRLGRLRLDEERRLLFVQPDLACQAANHIRVPRVLAISAYACMYACMHACMHICMYACMW